MFMIVDFHGEAIVHVDHDCQHLIDGFLDRCEFYFQLSIELTHIDLQNMHIIFQKTNITFRDYL